MKNTKVREPLFHVAKNDAMPTWKSLCIRIGAILVALVLIGILSVVLIQKNPFEIYAVMFKGAFVDLWTLFKDVAVLVLFGLAVIPAFRMKFWNMGANGQVLVGCLAAIAVMWFLTGKLPSGIIMLLMVVVSILAAVIWSVIPAIFKAFFNTNETLFTLMMNYIAIALVDYCVFSWDKSGSGTLGIVNLSKPYKHVGWFPELGNKYMLVIIVAVVAAVFMFIYMKYSKHGFEVDLVGESVNTAKYVGINVRKVIIRTLVFCGVIGGLLGALYAGAIDHTVNTGVGGLGFTAILAAWLANFNPLVMMLTSFFVCFLDTGAKQISTAFSLGSNDYANIVIGIMFFCVIACEFFIRFRVQINAYWKNKFSSRKKLSNEKEDV